jgi:ubiquinone/menaquinone biosynthesis C-methylase UbiE
LTGGPERQDPVSEAVAVHSSQAALFADRYEGLGSAPYSSCFHYGRKRLHAMIDRLLPGAGTGRRLLDVGCGTGHQLAAMRERGYWVAGVDGAEAMLDHARKLNPDVELRRGDVEVLPFETSQFDVVLCLEVLRYLPRIERCVGEMARVLKPGGVCLATASPLLNLNGYPLVNRLVAVVPFGGLVRLRQYFHTSAGLRRAFLAAGFSAVTTHGVYMGLINWVERLAPSRLPRVLRAWEGLDAAISDRPLLRELSGMLLVHAIR